tara:strand:+ start:54958 stop:55254 length:297 start_codon:yes stop_codon:yes gene_type:complete
MDLTDKELEEIAYLARINIHEDKMQSLKNELEAILNLFKVLNDANTTDVEPMSHPANVFQPLRKDEVTETDEREALQEPAPLTKSGLFLVPQVIDEES